MDQIIEAGLYAASGKGQQSAIIIQVTNKELRDEISRMNAQIMGQPENHDPFYSAPVMLIVLGKTDWPTHVADGSLVMGNLMLVAHELGLGSCWILYQVSHLIKRRLQQQLPPGFLMFRRIFILLYASC